MNNEKAGPQVMDSKVYEITEVLKHLKPLDKAIKAATSLKHFLKSLEDEDRSRVLDIIGDWCVECGEVKPCVCYEDRPEPNLAEPSRDIDELEAKRGENSRMIYLKGSKTSFRCECRGNVFTEISHSYVEGNPVYIYRCNSCQLIYEGTAL
jgi:hypothetical protein